MSELNKKILAIILIAFFFPIVFGFVLGLPFWEGFKQGLFADGLLIGMSGFALLIMWLLGFKLFEK